MSKRKADGGSGLEISAVAAARLKRAQLTATQTLDDVVNVEPLAYDGRGISPVSYPVEHDIGSEGGSTQSATVDCRPSAPYTTLQAEQINPLETGCVGLQLCRTEYVTCAGVFDLVVLEGAVRIHGAHLTASTGNLCRVYAPYGWGLHEITCLDEYASIELRSVCCELVHLERCNPLWHKVWHKSPISTFTVLDDQTGTLPFQSRSISSNGTAMGVVYRLLSIKSHLAAARILISGAKGAGKSTFARTLANSIMTVPNGPDCVFWLDLDPGQPEFGIAGQISLVRLQSPIIGPAHTHALVHAESGCRTLLSHVIGANSPREDVEHYHACARDLMRRANIESGSRKGCPVIINCPGWITGSGAEIMQRLVDDLRPSNVVHFDSPDAIDLDLTDWLEARAGLEMDRVPDNGTEKNSRPASETRALQSMSYFHSDPSETSSSAWSAAPISDRSALILPFSDHERSFHSIYAYHEPLAAASLSTILEGMVVFLVACENRALRENRGSVVAYSPEGLPYQCSTSAPDTVLPPLEPRHSRCLGAAIIKHIDLTAREIHLITPMTHDDLALDGSRHERLVLVRGKVDSPEWYLTETAYYDDWLGRVESDGHGEALLSLLGDTFDVDRDDADLVAGFCVPYVTAVQQGSTASPDDAGTALSGRVWRARHLPRYR